MESQAPGVFDSPSPLWPLTSPVLHALVFLERPIDPESRRDHDWFRDRQPWLCAWTCADRYRSASAVPFLGRRVCGIRSWHPDFERRGVADGHASVESSRERAPGQGDTPKESQPARAAGSTRVSLPGVLRHVTGGQPDHDTVSPGLACCAVRQLPEPGAPFVSEPLERCAVPCISPCWRPG